jgi:hypothetical protein
MLLYVLKRLDPTGATSYTSERDCKVSSCRPERCKSEWTCQSTRPSCACLAGSYSKPSAQLHSDLFSDPSSPTILIPSCEQPFFPHGLLLASLPYLIRPFCILDSYPSPDHHLRTIFENLSRWSCIYQQRINHPADSGRGKSRTVPSLSFTRDPSLPRSIPWCA